MTSLEETCIRVVDETVAEGGSLREQQERARRLLVHAFRKLTKLAGVESVRETLAIEFRKDAERSTRILPGDTRRRT